MADNSPQNGNSFNAENQENNNENKNVGVKSTLRIQVVMLLFLIILIFSIVNYVLDHNKFFDIKKTTKLKQPRIEANSSLMCGGKVLITGGYKNFLFESPLKTTEIYDLKTNKLIKGPDLNFVHVNYEQFILPSCEVLIADSEGQIESYNPKTNNFEIWNVKPEIFKNGGRKPTYTLLKDGNILITGGEHSYNGKNYSYYTFPNAEILDTKTKKITKLNDLPFPLAEHMFFYDKYGNVIIFGGKTTKFYKNKKRIIRTVENHKTIEKTVDEKNVREIRPNSKLIKFDVLSNNFSTIENGKPLPHDRAVSVFPLNDESILVVGGKSKDPTYYECIEAYNLRTQTITPFYEGGREMFPPIKFRIFENGKLFLFPICFGVVQKVLIFDIKNNQKIWFDDKNFNAFEKIILFKIIRSNILQIGNSEYLLFSKKRIYRLIVK